MSDAYQDKELQSVEKDTGQALSSFAQIGAMMTALIPKRKAKVVIKKPKQTKPETQPETPMPHQGVKQDLLYIETQRAQGTPDPQIKQDLTQRSQAHRTAQTRFGSGEQYLNSLMTNAKRAPGGQFPSQGLAAKQANQKNMKR